MSVEENKAVVRRYIEELWGQGNMALADELVSRDLVDHNPMPGQSPDYDGHHQVVQMFRAAFPDVQMTLEDLIAEGDRVVDRWTMRATHTGNFAGMPATGKQFTIGGIDISRLENGKIVEVWHQEDIISLMQQLGAIPAPAAAG